MLRSARPALLILVLVVLAHSAEAVEYHDYFVGFSTEVMVSSDLAVSPVIPDSLAVEAISFAGAFGPASVRPVRFRAGMGWFPGRPFRTFAGVELPLYELLNRSRARAFGVYLLGDLGATIPIGWTANASLAILVPTSALGGIRIGVGLNRRADLIITLGMATGAYPVRSRR